MCEYCFHIKLKNLFHTPKDYEETIEYIRVLIEKQHFVLLMEIAK